MILILPLPVSAILAPVVDKAHTRGRKSRLAKVHLQTFAQLKSRTMMDLVLSREDARYPENKRLYGSGLSQYIPLCYFVK